ncbi:MAG: homoserine dehydrogenase [Lachnospiraceae bacterium]|nr:homoserine dehydrogenase [Candidatus Merdinaster equi]
MINVAVLGYGNIGGGVVDVIETNHDLIAARLGEDIRVKYVLDLREFPGDKHEDILVHDFSIIENDPEIDIVCETMGGTGAAYTFSKACLLAGKNVCTSNKACVAAYGPELIRIAKEKNVNYLFEASVGGGIPIIRPLNECLQQEKIESIIGIVNGTTNYMLTKMAKEGASYEDVLKEAQDKGYAEKDPTADVEGHDAGRKIAILTSLMTGKNVVFEDLYCEGISKITAEDFKYASKVGRSIKLFARSTDVNGKVLAMVAPYMIDNNHPLFAVNDVFNAILVHGNCLDDAMFYGRGAGKLPTASAVVADVIEMARNLHNNLPIAWSDEKAELASHEEAVSRFFVRVKQGSDVSAFGSCETIDAGISGECAVITGAMSEKEYLEKAAKVSGIIKMIRVEA